MSCLWPRGSCKGKPGVSWTLSSFGCIDGLASISRSGSPPGRLCPATSRGGVQQHLRLLEHWVLDGTAPRLAIVLPVSAPSSLSSTLPCWRATLLHLHFHLQLPRVLAFTHPFRLRLRCASVPLEARMQVHSYRSALVQTSPFGRDRDPIPCRPYCLNQQGLPIGCSRPSCIP